ncbi:hypothetical protein GCM10020367_63500 [Streptomyces sannanensis]|uniref:Chaplin n=1 Tax=Streptomyces sannanensis TaxID=285536 RepID=A0ABP6SL99_9ACTN
MRTRHLVGAAAVVAVGMLGPIAVGAAAADTNINVHSPSMMCDTGTLSASSSTSACVARQGVEQEVIKSRTRDMDVVNRLDVAVPTALGG